ncbi:MAG: 23S rRNA (guanosine(2251)-2'-O)-methyltransferase RlmB [Treponema sp.]|jgi:23S rRNA (guanosine2251-2'-O)-methyltransferase|nr:23S rRNA (guanosine(2251)-2'-O)-methyltransferase RlmB [Treponema sp.]
MYYLTGFHAIEELLKSGNAAGPLLVAKAGPRARELVSLAGTCKIRVDRVGTYDLDRLAPGHRGLALAVDGDGGGRTGVKTDISLEEFLAGLEEPGPGKDALVLVLDEITDPHNYGAILRSCDQFGADLVVSRNRRGAKHAGVIAQTSAGAAAWVPAAETPNLPRALEDLKAAGFWIYGADMKGEALYSRDLRGRAAIILGSEGQGISRLLRERCDAMIAIPAKGRLDSLNVSVAAGILLYEVIRQRRSKG